MPKKFFKISTFAGISFGFLAGCSDDANVNSISTSQPADDNSIASICGNNLNSFVDESSGLTYCFDNANQLQDVIDANGNSMGIPPSNESYTDNGASSLPKPDTIQADNPSVPNDGESSADETFCQDPIDGAVGINKVVSSTDGSTYMYNASCIKITLTRQDISSSNSNTPIANSSDNETSSSSSDAPSGTVIQSSSSATISNGNAPTISYAGTVATVTNDNGCITVDNNTTIISCAGEYTLTGNGKGQVQVAAGDEDKVYLNLNNLTLSHDNNAPIFVKSSDKTFIVVMDGTDNNLSDGSNYLATFTKDDGTVDTIGAAIFAKSDLTIKGNGSLKVSGNNNNGIQTSKDLRFRESPSVQITAKNNGLKGKNSVDIEGGDITIEALSGDGIKSDECTINGTDTTITEGKGIVSIKGGTINISKAGDDGIQAFNYIKVQDSISTPTINITSTGKGLVSDNHVIINAGNITVTTGDDGIHSNMNVYFNGGFTTITAKGNDGVHADSTLYINDGTIYVKDSYEGLEAWYIKAKGGITDVYGSDDGWNAAGGKDGSGNSTQTGNNNWGRPGGNFGGGFGGGNSSGYLLVTGGVHYVKTGSGDTDGIDSNGELTISGGVVVVECQISGGMGGSFDSDGTATITTKTLLGFSKSRSEAGTSYNVSFNTNSYYGNSSIAFKPTTSGSYIQGTSQVATVSNTSSYTQSVTLPSGNVIYYNN